MTLRIAWNSKTDAQIHVMAINDHLSGSGYDHGPRGINAPEPKSDDVFYQLVQFYDDMWGIYIPPSGEERNNLRQTISILNGTSFNGTRLSFVAEDDISPMIIDENGQQILDNRGTKVEDYESSRPTSRISVFSRFVSFVRNMFK